MALLGWLWLVTPFLLIAAIHYDRGLQILVAEHHGRLRAAGWIGVVMMFLGATLVHGAFGTVLFALGTPLVGLIVFLRRDDGDDGGEGGPDEPQVDWDDFERSFWAHVRRSGRSPQRSRAPVS